MSEQVDIAIIGTGIGGSTIAHTLASTGKQIVLLERGDYLSHSDACRDERKIFEDGFFRPDEEWLDTDEVPFNPGNYYYVGGNSKFYGAVLTRYRSSDFTEVSHPGGVSPAWPFPYETLEPWYSQAEQLYRVCGSGEDDPTEPSRTQAYSCKPVPHEPAVEAISGKLRAQGLHPFSLPLAVDLKKWLALASTPWDAYPDTNGGKFDAQTAALEPALRHDNLELRRNAQVTELVCGEDGRISAVRYKHNDSYHEIRAKLTILCAGAVNSAALLLSSTTDRFPSGLANSSDQVGRNFMNHNATAMLTINPLKTNPSVYQKTLGFNDFYEATNATPEPLGNVQLLGKVNASVLKSTMSQVPRPVLKWLATHSLDWYLMSEDLPDPDSRVIVKNGKITLDWRRTNWAAHTQLIKRCQTPFRRCGYPLVLHKTFNNRTPSHQCGTARIGTDPNKAPLNEFCRAHDHSNLFVVDGGFLPTSAAVNPALTIAAQALRVGDHIKQMDLH